MRKRKGTHRAACSFDLTRMTVNRNGSVEFSYDRNGNQTSEIHKAGNDKVKEIRYNWGVNDRLDRMEFPQLKPDSYGTKVLDFVYTPAGNRVRKTYKDNIRTYTDRLYVYNGAGTLVEEFDIKSNRLETIHAGNIRIKDNLVEYDFRDMLSSTVLISDAAGKVLQRYRYDPFGEIEQAKGNSDNRFLFNGKEADESGLSYYGARYYNSITGRWISRDPLAGSIYQPQSLNRYQFCYNNPIKYVDSDGRFAFAIPFVVVGLEKLVEVVVVGGIMAAITYQTQQEIEKQQSKAYNTQQADQAKKDEAKKNEAKVGAGEPTTPNGGGKDDEKDKSINQINKDIQKGKSPKEVERADVGKIKGEQDHIHLKDGRAINRDGTWKHGKGDISKGLSKWLDDIGWKLPTN